MADGKIKFDRLDEEGEIVATFDVGYTWHKGDKGSLYGAYPHPPSDPFVEVYPIDSSITLTPEEEERASQEAMEQMVCESDQHADLERDSMHDRDDFADVDGDW